MTVLTKRGMIRSKHQVREDFSSCSTGSWGGSNGPYYETKGSAICAYESALDIYDLCFNWEDLIDMPGDDGRVEIEVWTNKLECSESVGLAIIMWHRMDHSGRWEFTGYLA